jgi:hypothetical protein
MLITPQYQRAVKTIGLLTGIMFGHEPTAFMTNLASRDALAKHHNIGDYHWSIFDLRLCGSRPILPVA